MMTLNMETPGNYGRILRKNGKVCAIREARDCTEEELKVKEVNLAVYLFEGQFLQNNIFKLTAGNQQKEYYLTDLVQLLDQAGRRVGLALCPDPLEVAGINSKEELAAIEARISGPAC